MVQIVKLFPSTGYNKEGIQLQKGGGGAATGRWARWCDCQVDWSPSLQVFKWVIRSGRSQGQACWLQEQQDFPRSGRIVLELSWEHVR